MKIFLSYASEQRDLAKEIALALRAENHTVFFDSATLAPGEAYNAQIREAVEDSQLFMFLISPGSITPGRYTLTELEFAEKKWPKPWGKVLSVMTTATPKADIPPYLRAGSILQPSGNISATVAAEVQRMQGRNWWRWLQHYKTPLLATLLLALVGAGAAWRFQQTQVERTALQRLFSEANIQQDSGHYEEAWSLFEEARSLAPDNAELHIKEARLAMTWLENARVTNGKGSFSAIVDKLLPTLSTCSISTDKVQAANCFAYMGWGDFLKSKEGQGGLKPEQFYQRAIALDPDNVYAHAMGGFHVLKSRGSIEEAKAHFTRALASGKERPYVRKMQLAAYYYYSDERAEEEAMRVLNDMRRNNEPLLVEDRDYSIRWSKSWNVYYSRLLNGREQQAFFSALSPSDHLATFLWLFPAESVPESKRDLYRFFLGSLQELAGKNVDALATFTRLQQSWGKSERGTLIDKTGEAIKRLSKLNHSS